MTTSAALLSALLAGVVLVDWVAVARRDRRLERVAKPAVMVVLIALAWVLHGAGQGPRPALWLVVAALVLSLVGDVALLGDGEARFRLGLGAFLLAHVAWAWAILDTPAAEGVPWLLIAVAVFLGVAVARWGRAIVAGAGPDRPAVAAYLVVIGAMALCAGWRGDPVVVAGAVSFVVSDTLLGHDRFVVARPAAQLQVMVTYHLAQVLLVVGLTG